MSSVAACWCLAAKFW